MRFTKPWNVMALKAFSATGAHIPRHGETSKKFEEAVQLLLDAAAKGNSNVIILPNSKTLRDL